VLIETLTGHDDRIDQARALALDYAGEKAAFHAGERDSDPLAHPTPLPASVRAA